MDWSCWCRWRGGLLCEQVSNIFNREGRGTISRGVVFLLTRALASRLGGSSRTNTPLNRRMFRMGMSGDCIALGWSALSHTPFTVDHLLASRFNYDACIFSICHFRVLGDYGVRAQLSRYMRGSYNDTISASLCSVKDLRTSSNPIEGHGYFSIITYQSACPVIVACSLGT